MTTAKMAAAATASFPVDIDGLSNVAPDSVLDDDDVEVGRGGGFGKVDGGLFDPWALPLLWSDPRAAQTRALDGYSPSIRSSMLISSSPVKSSSTSGA